MPRNRTKTQIANLQQVIAELAPSGRRRYPQALRQKIADFARDRMAAGVVLSRVCSDLGIGYPTLKRFLKGTETTLRPVVVVEPPAKECPSAPLLLHGPAGIVVECADVDTAAAFWRALS